MRPEIKIDLIERIIADYTEFGNAREDAPGIILAISTVISFPSDE